MIGAHRPLLVVLSILMGIVASFVAFDLAGRVRASDGRARAAWIGGGALAIGLGIWSLHFVGMLAFRLYLGSSRMPVGYDVLRILLTIVFGVTAAALALLLANRRSAGRLAVPAGALLLAVAIVGTHYGAMGAMRVSARMLYDGRLVLASVIVGLVAAFLAVWLATGLARDDLRHALVRRLGAATVTGVAIAAVHYTAMAAVRFTAAGSSMRVRAGYVLATDGLAAAVVSATLLILGMALLTARLDRRVRAQIRVGEEYAQLFRQADASRQVAEDSARRFRALVAATSQVVWTADARGLTADVSMWCALTGQQPDAARGPGWLDAVHAEDRARVEEAWQDALAAGTTFEVEYRLRTADGRHRWFLTRGVPVLQPEHRIGEWIGTCTDVHERRRADEAQELRLEASRVLSSSLELDETLEQVTNLLVPRLADYCLVHLRAADGSLRQVAAAHADPAKAALLADLGRRHRLDPGDRHGTLAAALDTRRPVLVTASTEPEVGRDVSDPEVLRIYQELRPLSCMIVPLVARNELLGSLTLATSQAERRYDRKDLELAEGLGARAALSIDNARLYREASEARDRAVRAAQLESQLAQARLQALRAQLNPHFLFNALNTIAMLVRRDANTDALTGVLSLSELMRRALGHEGGAEVALRDELDLVRHYLALERLRFRDRLRATVEASADTLNALVPSLVLQPIVENAIRHGVARRRNGGTVEVGCRHEDGQLVLEVCDDGPGFPSDWDPARSSGVGLSNTRERLQHMYGGAQRFEVQAVPGGGALVRLTMPFRTADER